jgi:glycosyltransferase involved in cell wall biosynthesis/Flp pilus assembly protein TadD
MDQNNETPMVSIIIPVFNIEMYIAECINSIKSQTLKNFEALLIDDASEDNSIKIAKSAIGNDQRFRIISHSENRGLPSARNTGLKSALGRYIWHVDGDDFLAEKALEKMVARAEADAADVVLGAGRTFPGGYPARQLPKELEGPISFANEPALWSGGGVVFFLFRRSFIQRLGNYFPDGVTIGEDKIYIYNTLPNATVISFIHDPCYYYRTGVGMTIGRIGTAEYLSDIATYIENIRFALASNNMAWNYGVIAKCEYRANLFVFATETSDRSISAEFFHRLANAYSGFCTDFMARPSSQPWRPFITVPAYLHKLYALLADGDGAAAHNEVRKLRRCYLHPEITLIKQTRHASRNEDALAQAERFTTRHPSHAVGFCELGFIQGNLGLIVEAEAAQRKALQLDSALTQSHLHLSKLLLRHSQKQNAIEHAARAVEIEPYNCETYLQLAKCFRSVKDLEKSTKCCKAALKIDPKSGDTISLLSAIEADKGHLNEAGHLVRNAIQFSPENNLLNRAYIELLVRQNKFEEAFATAKRWAYFGPHRAKPYVVIGNLLQKIQRYREAETAYRKAVQVEPKNPTAHKRLSQSLMRLERLDEAVMEAKRAVECAPGDPAMLVFLGNTLIKSNKLSDAESAYRRAVRLDPQCDEASSALKKISHRGNHRHAKPHLWWRLLTQLPKLTCRKKFWRKPKT